MKTAFLFLNGTYNNKHLSYYHKISDKKYKVAVDGGYQFFRKTNQQPDLLLGDFDSIKQFPENLPDQIEIVTHPVNKNKTDLELALDFVLMRGFKDIVIVQPEIGEVDHFLGNIFLMLNLSLLYKLGMDVALKFVNIDYEFVYIRDRKLSISNCIGDLVSVFPLSESIMLTESGFKYAAKGLKIKKGSSSGLRNQIKAKQARVGVEGKALIYHKHSKPAGK